MAENYSFFNSKEHDRKYNARHWADYFYPLFKSGVFNGGLQVVANGRMTVKINEGYAWIDGYVYHLTGGLVLDLEMASGNMNRKDNIVIRLDLTNRWIKGYCVTGAYYSQTATPPEPQVTTTVHELVIARINIPSGTTEITQDMIEDTRMDDSLCGWVSGTVKEIDYSQIYAQFTAYQKKKKMEIDEWQEVEEAALIAWVTTLKEEKTAQLQKLITDMENLKDDSAIEFSDWFTGNTNNWMDEFYSWFNNLKEQVTENIAIHLQMQIGNLNGLETEAKDSLTNAINEVHTDIETVRTEIVADVDEKVDSIRVLNAEATITKPGPWMIEFTKINNRSTQMYEPKDGDIIIVRFAAPYQGGNFTSVRLTGFYRGGYPIEYLLNCYSTEVYTSPFEGATVNMGYRNSIILNVVFKGNAPYFLLLNDLPFAQTERYKKAAAYQFPQKNLFLQSGAISMYSELDNAIKKRLECVENGEFTNDTIALALDTGCTYLLATVEYTVSSKAIYGYRMCMIAVPQTGVNKAVSRANLVASTNAGVTLANVAPENAGYVYREVTMKATSTYGVSYALYKLDAYYTGDF